MRAIALLALIAAVIPVCERRNEKFCSPDLSCSSNEEICRVEDPQTGYGQCERRDCLNDSGCHADLPFCDQVQGRCTKCGGDGANQRCGQAYPKGPKDPGLPFCMNGSCVACAANSDCTDVRKPVCDSTTSQCRACQKHADCTSGLCAKDDTLAQGVPGGTPGVCIPAGEVLVVDQNAASCGKPGTLVRCTLKSAMAEASVAGSPTPFVHLLKGSGLDFSGIPIGPDNAGTPINVYLIGPLADLSPWQAQSTGDTTTAVGFPGVMRGLQIQSGYRVTLEGLLIRESGVGVDCSGSNVQGVTQVRILRSIFGGAVMAVTARNECGVTIQQSWFGHGYRMGNLQNMSGNSEIMEITHSDLSIDNSLFWHNGLPATFSGIRLLDMAAGRRVPARIVNSTFVGQGYDDMDAIDLDCDKPNTRLAVLNTYLWNDVNRQASMVPSHIALNCREYIANLASEDPSLTAAGTAGVLIAGDMPGNTGFKDVGNGDLHLGPTAPAAVAKGGKSHFTDPAQTATPIDAPLVDLDGRPRPDGSVAIGCFEP